MFKILLHSARHVIWKVALRCGKCVQVSGDDEGTAEVSNLGRFQEFNFGQVYANIVKEMVVVVVVDEDKRSHWKSLLVGFR